MDMKTCAECGGTVSLQRVERYELNKALVGGMHVVVNDAVDTLVCDRCNAVVREDIPDLPGLMAAVAVTRATEPLKLNGKEIRFLRKCLGDSAKALAERLDVTEETVSRWENGHLAIGNATERLLRLEVCRRLQEQAPGIAEHDDDYVLYRMKIQPVSKEPLTMEFFRTKVRRREQWRAAA